MAASFTISDSESEPSEDLEEERLEEECLASGGQVLDSGGQVLDSGGQVQRREQLTLPELRGLVGGRIRLSSESQVQDETRVHEEPDTPTEGFPFRGRSKSAPPALWAAKKYGQQLRRMSDEFDSMLDKGEMKKTKSSRPIQHSKTWWSYLFSHQESEAEGHHDPHRNE